MTERGRPFKYELVAVLRLWDGGQPPFLMPVGYIVAWVFGIPTGESHALIAGNGYIRVTEGAGGNPYLVCE